MIELCSLPIPLTTLIQTVMGTVRKILKHGCLTEIGMPISLLTSGTHVAGTIGGKTVGVAKDVKLLDLKALDCDGSGTTGSILFGKN